MGRIKTKLTKRVGLKLYKSHSDDFSTDFVQNKKQVNNLLEINSKKLRNIIAGYITRVKKTDSK